jgi:hypothetical protein
MTTNRFYFANNGTAGPGLLPAGAWWTVDSSGGLSLLSAPAGSSGNSSDSTTAVASRRTRHESFRATTPRAGTLQGTLELVIATRQNGDTSNASLALRVRVVSSDGAIERGVLFEGIDDLEFAISGSHAAAATRRITAALTPVSGVQATDHIVVDIGSSVAASTAGGGIYVYYGSSTLLPDYPAADGVPQGDGRPWIDFTWSDPPGPPTGLTVTAIGQTDASVSWTAPASGATGYDVRADGGPPTSVGNVLAHTYTGLTPGTAYALEVRATNAYGASAWVSVSATTTDPQPPAPGVASQAVLSAAGLDPSPDGADAPAQQWWDMDPGDAETYSPARSIGLYGYSINYGSRDPLSGPQPITLTVQVMVPIGEHIGIGDRFRLRLCAPLAAVLGLDDDTGAIRATAIVTDSQADPMVMYDLPPHGPAIMYTIAATGWAPRYASARVDGTGWPTEAAGVRIGRILDGIGLAGTVPADGPDVLPPAAPGTFLEALAAVTDSINGRVVEQPHGLLDYLPADSRRGTLPAYSLDASEIIGTPFSWRESVGDIINTADVRYGSGTGEAVTVTNPASADPRRGVGTYATARTTVLAEEADASAYGTGLVGRRAWPFPQLPAVAVDLARSGLELARIAALFATRVGTRVAFTSMPAGSPWEDLPRGCFTEGYTETATAFAWRISLVVSDPAVSGVGLRYIDVPAGVSYLDVRNGLSYLDVARIEDPADLI